MTRYQYASISDQERRREKEGEEAGKHALLIKLQA
jgi:hypothetical protein